LCYYLVLISKEIAFKTIKLYSKLVKISEALKRPEQIWLAGGTTQATSGLPKITILTLLLSFDFKRDCIKTFKLYLKFLKISETPKRPDQVWVAGGSLHITGYIWLAQNNYSCAIT